MHGLQGTEKQGRGQYFKQGGGEGNFQITKSCLVIDKYRSEAPLKIDTVKDRGVYMWGRGNGGFRNPWNPFLATPLERIEFSTVCARYVSR